MLKLLQRLKTGISTAKANFIIHLLTNMRVEINLPEETLEQLQKLADAENRSRKNYIETVLIEIANNSEKLQQYKTKKP